MNKNKIIKYAGLALFLVGVVLLLANVRVSGLSLFSFNKGGIVLLLMGIDFVLMVWRPEKIFDYLMMVLLFVLIFIILKNVRIYLVGMSLLKYAVIAMILFGGLGVYLKGKNGRD